MAVYIPYAATIPVAGAASAVALPHIGQIAAKGTVGCIVAAHVPDVLGLLIMFGGCTSRTTVQAASPIGQTFLELGEQSHQEGVSDAHSPYHQYPLLRRQGPGQAGDHSREGAIRARRERSGMGAEGGSR
jgi:hypothetical protein